MENQRLNKLVNLTQYKEAYNTIQELERERIFCKHDMNHFLDVARIAWIYNLENNYNLSKEIVYTTALLHDIGRHLQYTKNIPHNEASVIIAEPLLLDCGYLDEEIENIKKAILYHNREKEALSSNDKLIQILYKADKSSRKCYSCSSEKECNWEIWEKNKNITT